ncbi:MAG: FecR family protein [Verrucomicrobium sp.]|nr:FecR domain-containing protein [Verrucomicrobium sp.]
MEPGQPLSPTPCSTSETGPGAGEAEKAAVYWLSRKLNTAEWTAEDERSLQRWFLNHSENQEAYLTAQEALAVMSQPGAFDSDEIARVLARPSAASRNVRRRVVALAAAAAVTVSLGLGWLMWRERGYITGSDYATVVGETRQVTLPDGTLAHLDAVSTLTYESSNGQRIVRLEKGAAVFEVAKDPRRSFQVQADGWVIRDIGTTFQVRLGAGPEAEGSASAVLEVGVEEGEVELRSHMAGTTGPVRLTAGEETTIFTQSGGDPIVRKSRVDGRFALWREGRLSYREEPLSRVLADLQRYHKGRIVLASAELGELTVTGSLSTKDVSQAFEALSQILPVQVTVAAGGDVRVERR